jgi:predicted permease
VNRDLRQAFRTFAKSPGLTATVLLTLAVGIGATTATFSIARGVLLRGLPYPDSERLVAIYNSFGEIAPTDASYLDIVDWRQRSKSFEDIVAAAVWPGLDLTGGDQAERVRANFVSATYFELLGGKAQVGRTFTAEEDDVPGGPAITVLSHQLWKRRFGSDPSLIGKTISLSGRDYTVVGVMPATFHDLSDEIQLWIPVTMLSAAMGPGHLEDRGLRAYVAVGRLKPGVSRQQAEQEIDAIAQRLAAEHPDTNQGYGGRVYPLLDDVYFHEHHMENVRRSVLVLVLGSLFVLLIACVNVANLLMARATTRVREMGARVALGASRWAIVRQLLTESVLLGLLGGALGVALAAAGIRGLLGLGTISLPAFVDVGLDGQALAVALAASLLTGIAFGLVPALRISRPDVRAALAGSGHQQQSDGGRLGRNLLVVSEVALAMLLLVAAGLMIRSFRNLHAAPMGFQTDKLLTMRINLPGTRYPGMPARDNFGTGLLAEVRALPGVQVAGLWGPSLPGVGNFYMDITREDKPAESPEDMLRVHRHHVTAGALRSLNIPILRGRDISEDDTRDQPMVAVVSESIAKALWPAEDPLGRRFLVGPPGGQYDVTVIGVAGDAKHRGRLQGDWETGPRDYYLPFHQIPPREVAVFVLTESAPEAVATPLRKIVQRMDPDLAVYDIKTARERLFEEEAQTRLTAVLMTVYAIVSMALASLGIFSVLAYTVDRRTTEIGIRMALGARRRNIYLTVVGWSMLLVAAGLAFGTAGAFAVSRAMRSLLYGVSPTDPLTFVLVPLGLAAVALLASWLPARRATRIAPVSALRYD